MDDFDIGPDEIAMFMGMAEEMAEEERERLQLGKEQESCDREENHDYYQDHSEPRRSSKSPGRRPKKDPFMQWVYDICHDIKDFDDPFYGPPKPKAGKKGKTEDYTRAVVLGVPVENTHLVSENFFRVMHTAFHYFPKHALGSIVFDHSGKPVANGREMIGIFDARSRSIVLNLRYHFKNSVHIVEHGLTNFSMHVIIWNSMVSTFLHELWHSLDTIGDPDLVYPEHTDIEDIADGWTNETMTFLARNENIEPPKLIEDPYFGPRIINFINRIVSEGKQSWGEKQRKMMVDGVYYRNTQAGIEISTMKEFYELSAQGLKGNADGHRLNTFVKEEKEQDKEAWEKEESVEMAAKEAIEKGYCLNIDYLKSSGDYYKGRVIRPHRFFIKEGYGYIEAFCEFRKAERVFRTDRIINIAFQP